MEQIGSQYKVNMQMKIKNDFPITLDIDLYRGDTFRRRFRWKMKANATAPAVPVNLTGFQITGSLKISRMASTDKFTITIVDRDDVNGEFTAVFPSASDVKISDFVYDIQTVSPSGEIKSLFTGNAKYTLDVKGSS